MSLTFDPPFPLPATLLLAALAFGISVWLSLQEGRNRLPPGLALLLMCLRAGLFLALAILLLNPIQTLSVAAENGQRTVTLLLDTSRSMNTADVPRQTPGEKSSETRREAAQRLILRNTALLNALNQRYNARFFGFDSQARAASPDSLLRAASDGNKTHLADAIRQALASHTLNIQTPEGPKLQRPPTGAILLVSDGRDNGPDDPVEAARQARALGTLVYALPLGKEDRSRDLKIQLRSSQVVAFPGQTIRIRVDLSSVGLAGATAQMDLLREGRRIASQTVTLTASSQEVEFPITAEANGFTRYTLVAAPLPGETDLQNNRAGFFLTVSDTPARLLLLAGRPAWETRFLTDALRSDTTLRLDTLVQLTDQRLYARQTGGSPTALQIPRNVNEFAAYDLLLLDRAGAALLTPTDVAALKQWISEMGGLLILLDGMPDEKAELWRELLPFTPDGPELEATRPQLTEAGRQHPAFAFGIGEAPQTILQRLPEWTGARQVTSESAGAVTLARAGGLHGSASGTALIAYHRYGMGKVALLNGGGLWRWALLPPEQAAYDPVFATFWTQLVHWLLRDSDFLPGQTFALKTDRALYTENEAVTLTLVRRPGIATPAPEIQITTPEGSVERLQAAIPEMGPAASQQGAENAIRPALPNEATIIYRPTRPGEYLATLRAPPSTVPDSGTPVSHPKTRGHASCAFTVYPGQSEDANTAANPELMRRIAAAGGGEILTPATLSRLPDKLRAAETLASRMSKPRSLWDRGSVLAFLFALLAGEWLLRRRYGQFT
jgi:hypothetical protein